MRVKKAMIAVCIGLSLAMVAPAVAPMTDVPAMVEAAAKPKLSSKKVTLTIGQKKTVKVKNGKIKSVKSSKKKVVKVKKKGKKKFIITAKKKGQATINVKLTNGKTLKCKVTIKKKSVATPAPSPMPKYTPIQIPQISLPAETLQKLRVVEGGYSINGSYVNYGVILENPNSNAIFEYPTITVTAYDQNGDVLATDEVTLNNVLPNEKYAYGGELYCHGETPSSLKLHGDADAPTKSFTAYIQPNEFRISGTNTRTEEDGRKIITGTITNTSNMNTDSVEVTALFRKDGKIKFGCTTYVNNLDAGEAKGFEFYAMDGEGKTPDYDSYEITAHDDAIR